MHVVPYKAEHMRALQVQQGQAYCSPYMTDDYAREFEKHNSFTGLVDGKPIIVGGLVELWQNRALLWSFVDQSAGKHFVAVHRATMRFLEAQTYRRIEAECDFDFAPGHRWLKKLGFVLEAPRMRAFRIDGGDSALYARVK